MCGGRRKREKAEKAPVKTPEQAAEEVKAQVEERRVTEERNVRDGAASIDKAFASFNDAYYDSVADTQFGIFKPQIEQQFRDAKGATVASLIDRGMFGSTAGADAVGRIDSTRTDALADAKGRSLDLANEFRTSVDARRSELHDMNLRAANPERASTEAVAAATSLKAPSASSIGDVFNAAINPLVAYRTAQQNSPKPRAVTAAPVAAGGGSGRIVR